MKPECSLALQGLLKDQPKLRYKTISKIRKGIFNINSASNPLAYVNLFEFTHTYSTGLMKNYVLCNKSNLCKSLTTEQFRALENKTK